MIPPSEWAMKIRGRLDCCIIEDVSSLDPSRNVGELKLLSQLIRNIMPYFLCIALIYQAPEQAFGVIPHISRSVTKDHVRVIAISHDPCPFDIKRQKVPKPEFFAC